MCTYFSITIATNPNNFLHSCFSYKQSLLEREKWKSDAQKTKLRVHHFNGSFKLDLMKGTTGGWNAALLSLV